MLVTTLKQCTPLTINERARLYAVPALVAPEELARGVHGWREGHTRDAKVPSAIALDALVRGRNAGVVGAVRERKGRHNGGLLIRAVGLRSSLILQARYDLESVSHLGNAKLFQFSVPKPAQIFHRDAWGDDDV
jgi:hypothetical protein